MWRVLGNGAAAEAFEEAKKLEKKTAEKKKQMQGASRDAVAAATADATVAALKDAAMAPLRELTAGGGAPFTRPLTDI